MSSGSCVFLLVLFVHGYRLIVDALVATFRFTVAINDIIRIIIGLKSARSDGALRSSSGPSCSGCKYSGSRLAKFFKTVVGVF